MMADGHQRETAPLPQKEQRKESMDGWSHLLGSGVCVSSSHSPTDGAQAAGLWVSWLLPPCTRASLGVALCNLSTPQTAGVGATHAQPVAVPLGSR